MAVIELAGVALAEDLAHELEQDGLCGAALRQDERVRALHLRGAAVEQATLIFAQIQLVHHAVDVLAVRADEIDDVLLIVAALEAVAQGVQQDVVALVAAVGFVAEEHGRPLHIGHGRRAGIGEHVHRQHACGEGKFIVVRGLEGAFALRSGDAGDVPRDISKGARGSNVQGIFFVIHTDLHDSAQSAVILDTPVIDLRQGCSGDWRTVSGARLIRRLPIIMP